MVQFEPGRCPNSRNRVEKRPGPANRHLKKEGKVQSVTAFPRENGHLVSSSRLPDPCCRPTHVGLHGRKKKAGKGQAGDFCAGKLTEPDKGYRLGRATHYSKR